VHDGRRVLFVAEKMAALEVVHDRLVKAGIGDVCLELHSRQANKRAVLQEVDRTLRVSPVGPPGDAELKQLRSVRAYLNDSAARLHRPLMPSAVTPYRALGQQVKLLAEGCPPPELSIPNAVRLTEAQARSLAEQIHRLSELTRRYGPKDQHPWRGVTVLHLSPADRIRLIPTLESLAKTCVQTDSVVKWITQALGLSDNLTIDSLSDIVTLLELIASPPQIKLDILRSAAVVEDRQRFLRIITKWKEFIEIWNYVNCTFSAAAWEFDFTFVQHGIKTGLNSWTARLRRPYLYASRDLATLHFQPLPKLAKERLSLVERFLHAKRTWAEIDKRMNSAGTFSVKSGKAWRLTSAHSIRQ
jgi:hypothetical protein